MTQETTRSAPRSPASQMQTRVEELPGELRLSRRTGHAGVAGLISVWQLGWTAGCVFVVWRTLQQPELTALLFAVPFVVAWFAGAWFLIYLLFARESLRITPTEIIYRSSALLPLKRQRVPLEEFQSVREYSTRTEGENPVTSWGIQLETRGEPIRFGDGLPQVERLRLSQLLRQYLPEREQIASTERPADESAHDRGRHPNRQIRFETLTPSTSPVPMPSDCRFQMHRDWDSLRFTRKGGTFFQMLGGLAVVTFLNLFWNGIVGVFVLELLNDFNWGLFFFLIPFELIGLAFVVAWFVVLLSPWFRETFIFTPHEIGWRWTVFGLGWKKRYPTQILGRLVLQETKKKTSPTEHPFTLCFVTPDNTEVVKFEGLTQGEARWIADQALGEYHEHWFGRRY